jgi:iron(III) transport system substrate-binding protein
MIRALVATLVVCLSAAFAQAPDGLPDYYPEDYQEIVEASKQEDRLLIYSNMAEYNWAPVIEGFNELYPWIQVQTLDLGSSEVFERYYSETASGSRTGDLMATGAVDAWQEFVNERQAILQYESPEAEHLPDWSMPFEGLYTISTDPMVIVYNKLLLPEDEVPHSMQELAAMIEENPRRFNGKVTSYTASASFGYSINWAFVRENGEHAWEILDTLGQVTRPESSSGPMLEKITAGEYVLGYFISGIVLFPKMDDLGDILGWTYIEDGNPVFLRGLGIPKQSRNVNSAKLMLDFIVSHDGQVAFGEGNLTPYRPDVAANEAPLTYQTVVEAIGGEDNVIYVNYDPEMVARYDEFLARWKQAFQR